MASATGVPERNPALEETEPLLGRPGDATQVEGQGLQWNFVTGTGESTVLLKTLRPSITPSPTSLRQTHCTTPH